MTHQGGGVSHDSAPACQGLPIDYRSHVVIPQRVGPRSSQYSSQFSSISSFSSFSSWSDGSDGLDWIAWIARNSAESIPNIANRPSPKSFSSPCAAPRPNAREPRHTNYHRPSSFPRLTHPAAPLPSAWSEPPTHLIAHR